jgi:hypothetical protein
MGTLNKSLLESLKSQGVGTAIHDLLVAGPLKHGGSWGGVACRAHLSLPRHVLESTFWMLVCYVTFHLFNLGKRLNDLRAVAKIELDRPLNASTSRILDRLLATVHFAMFGQLIYYKWNFSSLINLIQPCHVILFLEGVALSSDGPLGVMITTIILPALSGTFLALLFPDTTGLDQPYEEISYWIQHYLIILVPIYLLQRSNGVACRLCSNYTIGIGIWILAILHFSFYEVKIICLLIKTKRLRTRKFHFPCPYSL